MSGWNNDVVTSDDLANMTEEDIAEHLRRCRSEMGKRAYDVIWREKWEREIAYAQNELGMRADRRTSHREWQQAEERWHRSEYDRERNLPEYDGNRIPRFIWEALRWN